MKIRKAIMGLFIMMLTAGLGVWLVVEPKGYNVPVKGADELIYNVYKTIRL